MDGNKKASAVRISGLLVSAVALFAFISTLSYLFHWQQDLSLLAENLSASDAAEVGNAAGKLGLRAGHLLVCELFGLGSFALVVFFVAAALRLLIGGWRRSLLKTALASLFGAAISSVLLAYCGQFLGWDYVFGGGLGGRCGSWIVALSIDMFGAAVTGIFVLLLVSAFLFFSSSGFNRWFAELGMKKEKKIETQAVEAGEECSAAETAEEAAEEEIAPVEESSEAGVDLKENEPAEKEAEEGAESAVEEAEKEEGKFEIVVDDGLEYDNIKDLKPIDNRLDPPDGLPKFRFPSLDLLKSHSANRRVVTAQELERNNNKIRAALANFRIQITDVKAIVGPTVTLYKVKLDVGVKISEVQRLDRDIAMSMGVKGLRVVALTDSVGIEVANDFPSTVPLKSLLNDVKFRESKAELPVAIGYTITQEVKVFDLSDAPHLLVAGATKQGKSVGLNVIVSSLLYSKHPSEMKFVFIDPKMVEFSAYSKLLKHYLAVLPEAADEEEEAENAIVKDPKRTEKIMRSLVVEMDERYMLLSKAGVNKVTLYNQKYKERKLRPDKGHKYLPYLVVVVDEFADLTTINGASPEARAAAKSTVASISKLAAKGRAAGLHLILATQRPSVDVITGTLKSNFPMRIAFRVAQKPDSMTILDSTGAEQLIGNGDMLFSSGIDMERIQCGYVDGEEIDAVTKFIAEQKGYGKSYNTPYYLPEVEDAGNSGGGSGSGGGAGSLDNIDDRFEEAAKMVVMNQKGSTSDLQRKLGMGFARAGKVMDQLEMAGIVGPQEGSKTRTVLIPDLDTLQTVLNGLK